MTRINEDERRARAADIAYRRRAHRANSSIYGRRHGPELLPLLSGNPIRSRYVAEMAWLASEPSWGAADARRVSDLAAAIARCGCLRPDITSACDWHAARLRELVRQHEAVVCLEAENRLLPAWPEAARPARMDRRRTGARQ